MLRLLPSNAAYYQQTLEEIRQLSTSSFVLYYAVVIGFCALVRCVVLNRICDCPLRPRLLEAITCAELYACWLGHLRVAAVYGPDIALMALASSSVYRWMTQCPGTTANPLSYMLAFVVRQCSMTVEETFSRIAIQVGCALVSHTLASAVWQQLTLGRHPAAVVAGLHCGHPDAEVDAAVTAAAQFLSVLMLGVLTLRFGSVVVDMFEMIGQLIINALLIAGGYNDTFCSFVAVYLNPLIALSQLPTCLNREVVAHLVLYWLISISAVLLVGGGCCSGCCSESECSMDWSQQRRGDVEPRQRSASRSSQRSDEQQNEEQNGKTSSKQQQQNEEKKGKKSSSHHESRQEDRQSGKKARSNGKWSKRSRSIGSAHEDDQGEREGEGKETNQNESAVISGYETETQQQQQQQQPCCQLWQCRGSKSHHSDTQNRSGNAVDDDDDDNNYRISALLRAFRLSQLSETNTVQSVDNDRVSHHQTTPGQHRSRTASCDDSRRSRDCRANPDDNALTPSLTRETNKQRTANDSRRAHYDEDKCSEYNDSDEGDQGPKDVANVDSPRARSAWL